MFWLKFFNVMIKGLSCGLSYTWAVFVFSLFSGNILQEDKNAPSFHVRRFCRAVDKREYLLKIRDNFCLFSIKTYVVTPHQNRLSEGSQHMISVRNKKNYPSINIKCSSYLELCFA